MALPLFDLHNICHHFCLQKRPLAPTKERGNTDIHGFSSILCVHVSLSTPIHMQPHNSVSGCVRSCVAPIDAFTYIMFMQAAF